MTDEPQTQTEEDRLATEIVSRRGRKPKVRDEPQTQTEEETSEDAVSQPQKTKSNLVRVIVKRHYHPANEFLIDGKEPSAEQRTKVFSGAVIDMDRAEAKDCYAKGIVAPYDPFG